MTFRPQSPPPGPSFQDLTPRERQILNHLSKGLLYKEIADQIGESYHTVNNHVRKIYEKLHVNTRTEATVLYLDFEARPENRPH